jgi:hypothetical protein
MSDNSVGTNQPETKKTGSNKVITLIGIAIIILLLVVIVILLLRKPTASETTSSPAAQASQEPKREVLVNEDNVEELVQEMQEQEYVPQGYYTVTQNYEWHFPKASSPSTDAHVENLAENTNDVYFDLFLENDMENPIYQSPVIPRGAALEGFKLDKEMEAGTYDCIMVYHLVDENQNSLSTVSMAVKITVGE